MDAVRTKLAELQKQYDEISESLMQEDVVTNPRELTRLSREQARLQGTVAAWRKLQELDRRR